ncbi:MAG TPA: HD domain-containing protein [Tissierellaceae bacterium]|nr:HD domain-containing protein [Tissierellaceae bacterium]
MEFTIPEYVNKIIGKLEDHNYKAFIVGGSVRDLILGKEPSDFDITTNAKPDEIEEVFKDYTTILVGKEFGTVAVVQEEDNIEITTYRTEGEYIDGRRPSEVVFTSNLEEDLSRRDLTINAMAYNESIGLIDPFNGRKDLEKKKIKTVGNPRERFREDHLRILRAVRFATQLKFNIDYKTKIACKEMSHLLEKISMERIREELFKILLSEKPSYGIRLMEELDILDIIIPEITDMIGFDQKNPHHDKDVFNHTLCVVDNTPLILGIRLAALFHDIGKPYTLTIDEEGIGHFYGHDKIGADMTKKILRRLKCANKLIYNVTTLIKEHMTHHNNYKDRGLKRLIKRVGKDNIFNLIELQKSDRMCSSKDRNIDFLIERKDRIRKILEDNEVYEKKQLAITGYDIIELGYSQGKIIGDILDYLTEKVIDNPELNNKEELNKIILREYRR